MLDDLTTRGIICGYRRIGRTIAEEFWRRGGPCVEGDRSVEARREFDAAARPAVRAGSRA